MNSYRQGNKHAKTGGSSASKLFVFLIIIGALGGIGYLVSRRTASPVPPRPVASSTTTSTVPASTTTTTQVDTGPFGVGLATFNLSEPGKQLCAPHGVTAGCVTRSMTLYVRYPTLGAPGGEVVDAKPYLGDGPYPMIVFGNGYLETDASYAVLLDYWVSRGYVVASPQFPLSQVNSVGGPWEADVLNQPGDLGAAMSFVLGQSNDSVSKLYGLVNASEIALAGQSDGGNAALAAAYNTCCTLTGIHAVISLSASELATFPGKYFTTPGAPLLVVQGTQDPINPPIDSETIYDQAANPKYYLSLLGADHLTGYQQVTPYTQVVQQTSVAFLNYYLKGEPSALDKMNSVGNVAGVSTLS